MSWWSGVGKRLLASFEDNESGDRFMGGALLWRKATGFDGNSPSREEAIKATLGAEILLCGPLERWGRVKRLCEILGAQAEEKGSGEVSVASTEESGPKGQATPARSVDQLLRELGCPSANQVLIGRPFLQAYHSAEAAKEAIKASVSSWVAKFGGKELLISDPERDLLEQPGAEVELADYVPPCD